jgi:hypothetical protein
MKLELIGKYTFGMGGTMPDAKDFYEVAMEKIEAYEIEMGYPQYEGEPEVFFDNHNDENELDLDTLRTMHITTPLFNYIVGDMMEHDEDSADNYCTFTLTKEI